MDDMRHWSDRRPGLEVLRCPACGELHLDKSGECELECDAEMEEVYVSRADDEVDGAVEALYSAHEFIKSVTRWNGQQDDQEEVLAQIEKALPRPSGGQ